MKKLGTLKLKNASVLSEKEMKGIFGGSGDVSYPADGHIF